VRQGVQKWLKVVPVLSAEIGDSFRPGRAENIGKTEKLTTF